MAVDQASSNQKIPSAAVERLEGRNYWRRDKDSMCVSGPEVHAVRVRTRSPWDFVFAIAERTRQGDRERDSPRPLSGSKGQRDVTYSRCPSYKDSLHPRSRSCFKDARKCFFFLFMIIIEVAQLLESRYSIRNRAAFDLTYR